MRFDFFDLKLFAAIAEHQNLTRAAERVHTSLSAASVRVKNLEERLGVQLLYRSSQGVTLSPAGEAMAHHARLVLAQMDHLISDMQAYGQGIKGHLRVLASATAVSDFVPKVLGDYLVAHPNVNVDLREKLSIDIVHAVSDGLADLGIVSGAAPTHGLEVRPYRDERLVLVVPLAHPLAQRQDVGFVDALSYDHVGLNEGSAITVFLAQIARSLNRGIKLRIQVSNFEAGCRMVEADVGVSIMPASVAWRYEQYMAVRILTLRDAWSRRNLQICARSFEDLPGFAKDLVALLQQDALQHQKNQEV